MHRATRYYMKRAMKYWLCELDKSGGYTENGVSALEYVWSLFNEKAPLRLALPAKLMIRQSSAPSHQSEQSNS